MKSTWGVYTKACQESRALRRFFEGAKAKWAWAQRGPDQSIEPSAPSTSVPQLSRSRSRAPLWLSCRRARNRCREALLLGEEYLLARLPFVFESASLTLDCLYHVAWTSSVSNSATMPHYQCTPSFKFVKVESSTH